MNQKQFLEFVSQYATPLAVLVGAVLISGSLIYGTVGGNTAGTTPQLQAAAAAAGGTPPGQPPAVPVNIEDVDTANTPYIGSENAPVVVAYWSDYQCPY